MNKNKAITFVFAGVILSLSVLNALKPDKEFSAMENRTLAQLPKFNIEDLKSGVYASKVDTYINDQFIGRDNFLMAKSDIERLLGKKENNGVYFGSNGYLFEKYNGINTEIVDKNIKGIENFANRTNIKTTFALIPNSSEIYKEYLPKYIDESQSDVLDYVHNNISDKISLIDSKDVLLGHKSEYIYYKTDHHFTTLGAYYIYEALGKELGYTPLNKDDFQIEKVADDFEGTYYSKANDRFLPKDEMYYYLSGIENNVKLNYNYNTKETNSLYNRDYLNKKDKYASFLDSNNPIIEINTGVKNGKNLLVFKDSYAHCLIPFLANHFENIVVLDLRYFNTSIQDILDKYKFEDCLMFYNVNTFNTDKTINKLNLLK